MLDIIYEIVKSIDISVARRENFAIAFSGGLDSSLLAKIVKDNFKDVTLLTIGFPGSHDIEFSKFISDKMSIKHITSVSRHPLLSDWAIRLQILRT